MPDQAELLALYQQLDERSRQSLIDFARFLHQQQPIQTPYEAPVEIPRGPRDETVVAAMQRLRQAYDGLDTDHLLSSASALMGEHLLQGRAAADVIVDLEALFAREAGRQSGQVTTKVD